MPESSEEYGWSFSKEFLEKGTPSRKDGISGQREAQLCRSVYKYLNRCAEKLVLHHGVVNTAQLYFLRYFALKSMRRNDPQVVALSCLLLSAKLHECISFGEKNLSEFVKICVEQRKKKKQDTKQHVDIEHLKRRVIYAEFAVLHVVGFDLTMQPPYKYVLELLQSVTNMDEEKKQQSRQISQSLLDTSMETSLPLQCHPKHLAEVALFITIKGMGLQTLYNDQGEDFLQWCSCPLVQFLDLVLDLFDLFELTNDQLLQCVEEVKEAIVKRQLTPSPGSQKASQTLKSGSELQNEVEEGEIME
eukprot:TRINITY_DN17590_c0_g1_i10.p1 TRINITY_DN17590_c0_g1~~TRINITY_DN17590_c0_g1_i10.p1  ORF type:complete len:303 (-),score=45.64 TRINITY_DN17590_c0_g1_i10:537-1445(-)